MFPEGASGTSAWGDQTRRRCCCCTAGPGASSGYLQPLMAQAADDFLVVRYDQLGSWNSDKPDDLTLWQVPRFVAEVEGVRQALGLGRVHLLGQSWGSFLGLEYALHHQQHLRGLTLVSGAASTVECVAGDGPLAGRATAAETQTTLARYEATQEYNHPDYLAAVEVLYRRHLCRVWPYPQALADDLAKIALPVYTTMWGPNEFTLHGNPAGVGPHGAAGRDPRANADHRWRVR